MRLIDADALRDKLQEEIDKAIPPFDDVIGSIRCGVRLARNIVEDEPTIDAVPVIRCKDCVHWEKNNWNPNGMCNAFDDGSVCILTETDADEYCSRAERKEE